MGEVDHIYCETGHSLQLRFALIVDGALELCGEDLEGAEVLNTGDAKRKCEMIGHLIVGVEGGDVNQRNEAVVVLLSNL
jgi:hypothetical protein